MVENLPSVFVASIIFPNLPSHYIMILFQIKVANPL
jgi:hypothetical protein